MMRLGFRAWMTRTMILLFSALLTAAQTAVFLTADVVPERAAPRRYASGEPGNATASPRTYGNPAARFTLTEYADLECSYCASSFESIRRWIDDRTDARWQWRHLPLAMHEPNATNSARWAECIRETQGNAAFWSAIARHYERLRQGARREQGDGAGQSLKACLNSTRPDAVLRADAEEAARLRVTATPTLMLHDRVTGRQITLRGAASNSLLLSAIDALTSSSSE